MRAIILIITCVSVSLPVIAQDAFGWKPGDTIKVDLATGMFSKKYIPFDVPFVIYGNSKGIKSVKLQIIDADYQTCSPDYPDRATREKNCSNCDCACQSVVEQRINFFKTVLRINNKDDVHLLDSIRIYTGEIRMLEMERKGILEMKMDSSLTTFTASVTLMIQLESLLDPGDSVLFYVNEYWNKNRNRVTQFDEAFSIPVSDTSKRNALVKAAAQMSLKFQRDILKIANVVKTKDLKRCNDKLLVVRNEFNELNEFNKKYRTYAYPRMYDVYLYPYIPRPIELPRPHLLPEKTEQETRWNNYLLHAKDYLQKDPPSLAKDGEFDPKQCNVVCAWANDGIISSSNFYLPIPALKANKTYSFFFSVTREIDDSQKESIKNKVVFKLLAELDTVTGVVINQMLDNGYSIDDIRTEIIDKNSETFVEAKHIAQVIRQQLILNSRMKVPEENQLVIDDTRSVKSFLNFLIGHNIYKRYMANVYNAQTHPGPYSKLGPELKFGGLSLHAYRDAFYKEKHVAYYQMLDSLNYVMSADNFGTILRYFHPSQQIIRDASAGLVPFKDLQSVGLRKLNEVNDFDTKTIEAYIRATKGYADYLGRLNNFLEMTLVYGKDNIRTKLFASGMVGSELVTKAEMDSKDKTIRKYLVALTETIQNHRHDVVRLLNIYNDYSTNLQTLNAQTLLLIDNVLKDNPPLEVEVNRQTGGLSSADFKTRSEWAVTADVGMAYIFSHRATPAALSTYFGANFNFHPVNREVNYSLFPTVLRLSKKKWPAYYELYDGSKVRKYRSPVHLHPMWEHFFSASSLVVGVTVNDLKSNGERENLLGGNLNLITSYGLRLTDQARISVGMVWTKTVNSNPTITRQHITPLPCLSFSWDIDVVSVLGKVGELLGFNK
ncbi:MAG: hypothetical protein WDO14_12775 [Bacteroidota bacterium]